MSRKQPPYAPEYRRQMVCASLWCERVARPESWLASSSAPRKRSATGSVSPTETKAVERTGCRRWSAKSWALPVPWRAGADLPEGGRRVWHSDPLSAHCSAPGGRRERLGGVMVGENTWPEWVLRLGFACVWVRVQSASEAVAIAARRLGHMGGWRTGPDVDQEVFAAAEYHDHARPGNYTGSVITASRSQ